MLVDPKGLDELIALLETEKTSAGSKGPPMPPLIPPGNGGTPSDMSPDWKESVNKQLAQLHDDFRKIVGWILAAVAAPLLAIIGLYVYSGNKFDQIETKATAIQVEQARSAGLQQTMDARINGKLDVLNEKLSGKK